DLLDALRDVLERIRPPRAHDIEREGLSIRECVARILAGFVVGPRREFASLFGPDADRAEVIVIFLALLELIRLRVVRARQAERFGAITLELAVGGWQFRRPAGHGPWVRRLLRERPPRLSRPTLETVAIVAYRQPCTRLEIEAVRGVDAEAVLTTLIERRLVRIVGRKEAPGRPLLYATTREFLEVFGLPDLNALPPLRDLGDGAALLAATEVKVAPEGVEVTLESP